MSACQFECFSFSEKCIENFFYRRERNGNISRRDAENAEKKK